MSVYTYLFQFYRKAWVLWYNLCICLDHYSCRTFKII